MILIDSHLDLSLNAVNWNRDLTRPCAEIRRSEAGLTQPGRGANTVALPDMRTGDVAICFATVLARVNPGGKSYLDFRTQAIASAMAQGQLAYYRALEAEGELRQLRTWAAVERHLEEWKSKGGTACPVGYVFSMEGADPILTPAHVEFWWRQGLRVVGISHYGVSAYAHGTGTPGGLTARGPDLLKAMMDAGMALDVTHLADDAFWQALDIFKGPVLASHHNCRALVPGDFYALIPPRDDVHRVRTTSAEASVSIHLLTNDTGCVWRHTFDPDTGESRPFRSGYVNAACDPDGRPATPSPNRS
jgi:membrane dipeptidase